MSESSYEPTAGPTYRSSAITDRIATLRASFAAQIPGRLQQLGEQFAVVEESAWSVATVTTLITQLHEFAGSAITFGFSTMGEAARSLELALRAPVGPPTPRRDLDDSRRARITQQFHDLLQLPVPDLADLAPLALARTDAQPPHQLKPRTAPDATQTLYIVDDNLLIAEQLAEQLRYFGYAVETFGRLDSFAEAFRQSPPTLVVLDIDFPAEAENGPSMFGHLTHEHGTSTPAVFISSRDDIHSRLMAVRAGGSRYLVKPVTLGDLIDSVDSLLNVGTEPPYRILIVDDAVGISSFYATILQSAGMETRVVNDPLTVLNTLSEFQPDLALIDLYMPGCSGEELAGVIRQFTSFVSLPIVFISGETDRSRQLAAMQLGADDFLTKPIDAEHLIVSMRTRSARARQMRSLIKADSLTGLLNHISFHEAARVELERARRSGNEMILAMIDLDHFKNINDTHGHPVGDRVLRSIARQLRQRLRTVDIIGRYGGEEFAVILSGADRDSAMRVINSVREDFARIAHSSERGVFYTTFSAGVASFPQFERLDDLIVAADKGLYEAKRRGRNCAVFMTPPTANE